MAQIPLPRDAFAYTDIDGKERTCYVVSSSDRRRAPWRRMKKHIAETAALKLKEESQDVKA